MTVAIYEKPSALTSIHHQPRVRDRASRPQTAHAENTAPKAHTGVFPHLRNAFGLVLVFVGSVGMMYSLIFETFAR